MGCFHSEKKWKWRGKNQAANFTRPAIRTYQRGAIQGGMGLRSGGQQFFLAGQAAIVVASVTTLISAGRQVAWKKRRYRNARPIILSINLEFPHGN